MIYLLIDLLITYAGNKIDIDVSDKELLLTKLKKELSGFYYIYPIYIDQLYKSTTAIKEIFNKKGVDDSLTKEITTLIKKEIPFSNKDLTKEDILKLIEKNYPIFFSLNKKTIYQAIDLIGTKKEEIQHFGKFAFSKEKICYKVKEENMNNFIVFSFLNSQYLEKINNKNKIPYSFTKNEVFYEIEKGFCSQTVYQNISLIHEFHKDFQIKSLEDLARVIACRNIFLAKNFITQEIFYQEDLVNELVSLGFSESDSWFLFKNLSKKNLENIENIMKKYPSEISEKFLERKDYFLDICQNLFSKSHAISYAYLYYINAYTDLY